MGYEHCLVFDTTYAVSSPAQDCRRCRDDWSCAEYRVSALAPMLAVQSLAQDCTGTCLQHSGVTISSGAISADAVVGFNGT